MLSIAEGLSATRPCGRERACTISASETPLQIRTLQVFVEESGVEAVARADGVDGCDRSSRAGDAFRSSLSESASLTQLHDDYGHQLRKLADGGFQIIRSRRFARLALIGQKNIHITEERVQIQFPSIVGIIVGVERNRKSACFQCLKQLARARPQSAL